MSVEKDTPHLSMKGYYTVTVHDDEGNFKMQYLQKSVEKPAEEHKEAFCNMCGMTCQMGQSIKGQNFHQNYGLINKYVTGGFDSTPGNGDGALDDMNAYKFSLCEFCLDFLFSNFKNPPETYDLHDPEKKLDFVCAKDRVERDDWRREKDLFYKLSKEREEQRKLK